MASATPWTFILTDLSGSVLGEVTNASAATITLPLNRLPTVAFQIPLDHYLSSYLTNQNWDGLLKAYRGNTLAFNGPIVSSNEQFDTTYGQSVAVNAAGALWRLQFRELGTPATNTGSTLGWSYGDATTTYDLGAIAQQMLVAANAVGYTGISAGTTVASSPGSAGVYYFQDVMTAIAEIATGVNAFDFEVAPTEPTFVGQAWPQIGLLNCVPLIGTAKFNAVFEYGTSKANLISYGRQIDRSKMMTKGWIQQPAVSDYTGTLSSEDTTAEGQRGIFEGLVDNGGVEWDVLRQQLADANVLYRKQAQQVVTIQPKPNATPQPLVDYIVGDQIRARIVVDGNTRLDGMMRVWGITFTIDQQGNESPSLELVMPSS